MFCGGGSLCTLKMYYDHKYLFVRKPSCVKLKRKYNISSDKFGKFGSSLQAGLSQV